MNIGDKVTVTLEGEIIELPDGDNECLIYLEGQPSRVYIDPTAKGVKAFDAQSTEPTGLGVVVDAFCQCQSNRVLFVRDDTGSEYPGNPWKAGCGHHGWDELSDVRVLSEGWAR